MVWGVIFIVFLLRSNGKILEERPQYVKLELLRASGNTFYLQLFMGNHPQKQRLSVDTGSHLLVVKDQDCTTCIKTQLPYFKHTKSTTFNFTDCNKENFLVCWSLCPNNLNGGKCEYTIKYGITDFISENKGFLGKDDISFSKGDEASKVRANIGCNTYESSTNIQYDNGIMGLSARFGTSFIFDWFASQNIKRQDHKFSLCFQGQRGYLQLGNMAEESQEPAVIGYDYYSGGYLVNVVYISIQQQDLHHVLQSRPVLIDSGASSCIFPMAYFEKILKIVDETCEKMGISCKKLDLKEQDAFFTSNYKRYYYLFSTPFLTEYEQYVNENFPQIQVLINGTNFNLKPSQYLVYLKKLRNGMIWASLAVQGTVDNQTILGINWMSGKKIIFNVNENKQYMEVYDSYQCFDYQAEIVERLKNGIIGYSIILFIFLIILGRRKIACKWRGKCFKKGAQIPESQTP